MPARFVARKLKRFFIYRVLSLDDTPHRIALGVAIGIFVAWTPTMGLQMVLTVLLCTLFQANKLVGVPFVWISNPLTLVPVYGPNYLLGRWLLGGGYSWSASMHAIRHAAHGREGWWASTTAWWTASLKVFWPLWIGSLIVALLLGALSYVIIYHAVVAFRRHLHRRQAARGK